MPNNELLEKLIVTYLQTFTWLLFQPASEIPDMQVFVQPQANENQSRQNMQTICNGKPSK